VRVYCSRIAWAAVVCVFGVLVPQGAHAGPNVLLLWDDDPTTIVNSPPLPSDLNASTQALISAMEASGLKVTLADATQANFNGPGDPPTLFYTGSNPAPDNFDAVIHLNGSLDSTREMVPPSVVKLLAYVETDGGGLITSQNTEAQLQFGNLSPAMEALMLLDLIEPITGAPPVGPMSLTPVAGFESHPILTTGLTSPITFDGGRMRAVVRDYLADPDPATVIARDELGLDAVAVRELRSGRVVSFHHNGNYGTGVTLSNTLQDPEVQQLYINAVRWADQRPPTATITLEQPRAGASGAGFFIEFSEGVDGFSSGSFDLIEGGSLGGSRLVNVTPLSDRLFRVRITGATGIGTMQLNLRDDDTLVDQSLNANPLNGPGNGTIVGPVCPVDTIAPEINTFTVNPFFLSTGDTGELTITFNEPMDQAFPPRIRILTENNGMINANPLVPRPSGRVEDGLVAFYEFNEVSEDIVHDTSGSGTPLDLRIGSEANTHWNEGSLVIDSSTVLLSETATKISNASTASGEITIEAYVRPANNTQGPARIVSLGTAAKVNVALEQNADNYTGLVQTTTTLPNSLPNGITGSSSVNISNPQHIVLTQDSGGTTRLYHNNTLVAIDSNGAVIDDWDNTFKLSLARSTSPSFPWLGEFYLLAIYDRALDVGEVQQNYSIGPDTLSPGNGVWLNAFTYRVSLDRAVTPADEGTAQFLLQDVRDLFGNPLVPQTPPTLTLINSTLAVAQEPEAQYLRAAGQPFDFVVGVSGAVGGLDYQWYKEDAAKVFLPVGTNAPVLSFASLEIEDSGTYYCVINDIQDSVQTSPSQLEVVPALPVGGVLGLAVVGIAVALVGVRRRSAMR